MPKPRSLVLATILLAACSAGERRHAADASSAADLATADLSTPTDASMLACFEPQEVATVTATGSIVDECAIWNNLSSLSGQVTLVRSGASLEIDFAGGIAFSGTVTGSAVELTHAQTHTFTDGCLWLATETLTGTLDPTSCAMTVAYAYTETVQTSNGACATPCAASSTVSFSFSPVL